VTDERPVTDAPPVAPHVLVLGGGLAGVACAHRLGGNSVADATPKRIAWDDDTADRSTIIIDQADATAGRT
jgi:glycine/D-amino acid oxidase-like deaminating enzyme